MNELSKLFKKYRSIGVVGNTNTSKSSLVLDQLLGLKKDVDMPIYVLGAEAKIEQYLTSQGLNILHSADDILDLKIRDAVLYIDEFSQIFNVRMASKQTDRIKRFFNRLAHLNIYIVISTAETKFWNVFMCSLIKAYFVKEIEYDALVKGTLLKRKVSNITGNTSEYRLEVPNSDYYIITDDDVVTRKTFEYNENLDSKKSLINPFVETKVEPIVETKVVKTTQENQEIPK